ncbi:MAG TPA: hypothetical protein VGP72_13850 [Planctomycetota bacterium]|jgi:hypothetical protein
MATPASPIPSLWPSNVTGSTERTPLTILKEQAAALSAQTNNFVVGKATATPVGEKILIDFDLVVPTLMNYSYRLFKISHGTMPYPLQIHAKGIAAQLASSQFQAKLTNALGLQDSVEVTDENDFIEALRAIFKADATQRVLSALLAQAHS